MTCAQCQGKHHTLTHGIRWQKGSFRTEEVSDADSHVAENGHFAAMQQSCLTDIRASFATLRFAKARVKNPENGRSFVANVLLDDGSSFVCINSELCNKLELTGEMTPVVIRGFKGKITWQDCLETTIRIESVPPAAPFEARGGGQSDQTTSWKPQTGRLE